MVRVLKRKIPRGRIHPTCLTLKLRPSCRTVKSSAHHCGYRLLTQQVLSCHAWHANPKSNKHRRQFILTKLLTLYAFPSSALSRIAARIGTDLLKPIQPPIWFPRTTSHRPATPASRIVGVGMRTSMSSIPCPVSTSKRSEFENETVSSTQLLIPSSRVSTSTEGEANDTEASATEGTKFWRIPALKWDRSQWRVAGGKLGNAALSIVFYAAMAGIAVFLVAVLIAFAMVLWGIFKRMLAFIALGA